MSKYVVIIDYDIGNIQSITSAIEKVGYQTILTRDVEKIKNSKKIILPGVGSFQTGIEKLKKYGLVNILKNVLNTKSSLLGICLGMQLLFETSEESPYVDGLQLIKGNVIKLNSNIDKYNKCKIPHIGWNNLHNRKKISFLHNINDNDYFYHVHSYSCNPTENKNITSICKYQNLSFISSVNFKNIYGVQFHPEKSCYSGLKLLKNFCDLNND